MTSSDLLFHHHCHGVGSTYLVNALVKKVRSSGTVFSNSKTVIIYGFLDFLVFILDVQPITPLEFTCKVNSLYDTILDFVK